jgi:hypothetical protein
MLAIAGCNTTNPLNIGSSRTGTRHQLMYYFEHIQMPSLWFSDPGKMTEHLENEGTAYLEQIYADCQEERGIHLTESVSMNVEMHEWPNGTKGWILTFPKVKVTPESKYSALVFDGSMVRFFTYEYDDYGDRTIWFFCEWTPQHMHLNYGADAKGTKEAFIERITQMLDKQETPAAATALPLGG